jgi:hypothetical protein
MILMRMMAAPPNSASSRPGKQSLAGAGAEDEICWMEESMGARQQLM